MTSDEYTNFKYKNNSQLAAMMAMADINVLNVSTTNTTEFQQVRQGMEGKAETAPAYMIAAVVEYKWWYGPAPSENRWQRIPVVSCDFTNTAFDDRERDLYKSILCTVAGIRDEIEEQTGISQDVRH